MKIIKNTLKALSVLGALAVFTTLTSCNELADNLKVEPSDWSEGKIQTDAYLMSSIGVNKYIESDSLHLAYSEDGLTWTELDSNNAVFTTTMGSRHFRDPFIFRMNDGSFVLLASDFTSSGKYWDLGSRSDVNGYWGHPSNCIIVAFSKDLIHWEMEHKLQLTDQCGKDGGTRHVWTPKALYNKQYKCYDIYWVGDNSEGVNQVYVTQTYDFYSVKSLKPKTIYSPGYSVVDADIVKADGTYYMFNRDLVKNYSTFKGGDIQCAKLDGGWGRTFQRISENYINRVNSQTSVAYEEYPCVYLLEDKKTWIMLTCQENNQGSWSAYASENLSDASSWKTAADAGFTVTGLPSNTAASVVRITTAELDALKAAF